LNPDDFEKNKSLIKDNILLRRAKHCVYENFRAKQASQALKKDDLEFFGNLMRQSHISLKDDYEVSAKELDIAVDLANRQKGSYGARMTGAGFGGCAVSIIKNENIDEAINNIAEEYREGTGLGADFYKVTAANGGHLL
jgi:galactokinase